MNSTNEKLLKQLYGIRAGLSVIAQEHDEVETAKTDLEQTKQKIDMEKRTAEVEIPKLIKEKEKLQQDIASCIRYTQESYSPFKYFWFPVLQCIGSNLFAILLIIIALIPIASLIVLIVAFFNESIQENIWGPALAGFLVGGFLSVPSFMWSLDFFGGPYTVSQKEFQSNVQETQNLLQQKQWELKQIDEKIKYYHLPSPIEHAYQQKKQQLYELSSQKQKTSSACLEKLRKTYSPILDQRDWKYLDLITYYVETGRADTIKEALQLVDRQVQVNSILDAMQQATKAITESIQINTRNMMQVIYESTNLLSTQLGNIQASINTTILQNNRIIEQNNSALEQSKRVETAFKKYATTSSESLYALALNAEQEMRKRRNNLA